MRKTSISTFFGAVMIIALTVSSLTMAVSSAAAQPLTEDENYHGPGWYIVEHSYMAEGFLTKPILLESVYPDGGPFLDRASCEAKKPSDDKGYDFECRYFEP